MAQPHTAQRLGSPRYLYVLGALAVGLATLLLLHRGDRGSLPEATQELALWQSLHHTTGHRLDTAGRPAPPTYGVPRRGPRREGPTQPTAPSAHRWRQS